MLRIKRDINLKILEKYGFIKKDTDGEYFKANEDTNEIIVVRPDGYIYLEYVGKGYWGSIIEENALEDLFLLIKDNLIEHGGD